MKKLFVMICVLVVFGMRADNILNRADVLKASAYNGKIELAIDGQFNTSWSSYYGINAQANIIAEFLESEKFNTIFIIGYNLVKCEIEYSTDGEVWQKVPIINGKKPFTTISYKFDKVISAKKIKINLFGGKENKNIRISEISMNLVKTGNKALFKTITETSSNNNKDLNWRFPVLLLVDGNIETGVSHWSGYSGSEIVIDLEKRTVFNEVKLIDNTKFDTIEILVSDDNTNFNSIIKVAPTTNNEVITFDKVSARFVKIKLQGKQSTRLKEIYIY